MDKKQKSGTTPLQFVLTHPFFLFLCPFSDQPTVVATTTEAAAAAATATGRVESTSIHGTGSHSSPATNEAESDDDSAAPGEDEEEEEYEDEDGDEDRDEVSDCETESDQSSVQDSVETTVSSTKRNSISSTSAKSSSKAQGQPGNRSKSKAADKAPFKTRVFTNTAAQNRSNSAKQQQKCQSSQRKNSNEGNKLKATVLLIEEMYQPATRKASMQRASKKVATNPSTSSDEQITSKIKIKGCNNPMQQSTTGENHNPAAASKNWSRKSQTFTGATSSATENGSPVEPTANKSQQQRTAKKSKAQSEIREVVHTTAQMSSTSSTTISMAAGKKSATTLHQYKKLNMSDEELIRYLHHYLLDVDSLKLLGFPVECEWSNERAVIYKPTASDFYSIRQQQRQPTDLITPMPASVVPRIPETIEKRVGQETTNERKMPVDEDLVDDGIVTDELDLKLSIFDDDVEEEEEESAEEEEVVTGESQARRRKRRSALNRLTSVKLLSSSPPSSSSGNSSGIEDSSESNSSLPGSPSITRLSPEAIPPADEKRCSRCARGFFVTVDGEYLTQEHCVFHYGRVQRVLNAADNSFSFEYSCCAASPDTKGCTTHKLHVWSGLSEGCNGPYHGFVNTKKAIGGQDSRKHKSKVKRKLSDGPSFIFCADLDHLDLGVEEKKRVAPRGTRAVKVFALDCEMCFTGRGLELAKVTVVAHDGSLVYEKFVQPESEIIDYNTRFSGIKASDFHPTNQQNIRSVQQVQRDLVEFIEEDTILIGHGLENDLRALKLIHKRIIDTSIAFPHFSGLPFRRSLKSLTKTVLKRDIQTCQTGHDSYEDSLACVELMLWRVRKDFRTTTTTTVGYQQQQHNSPKRYQGNANGTVMASGRWS